jgi:tetratricopeptide (TPR) repeat protein
MRSVERGEIDTARHDAEAFLRERPGAVEAWMTWIAVEIRAGNSSAALAGARSAVLTLPEAVCIRLKLVELLMASGNQAEALTEASAMAQMVPNEVESDRLGAILTHCGQPDKALQYHQFAVGANPGNISYRYNLASAQWMTGAFKEAEANLDIVLAKQPYDGGAQLARSGLRRQTIDSNHVSELQRLLEAEPRPDKRISLQFALGKELEDLGRYDEAFAAFKAGNAGVRERIRYEVESDVRMMEDIAGLPLQQSPDCMNLGDRAIFVFGLPRSGTTLVDRMLATHERVTSLGETNGFATQCVQQARQGDPAAATNKNAFYQAVRSLELRPIAERYLGTNGNATGPVARVVDKTPLNYLYAGLIHRALPKARLVLIERDPLNSCFAMFKTLFTTAYPFTYRLDDLGRYYCAWSKLMSHWKDGLGSSLLVIRYEDLVSNPKGVSRRLFDYCGLQWNEQVLKFHEFPAPVTTASAFQVRQPLYTTSVDVAARYTPHLDELARRLRGALPHNAT